MRLAKDAQDLKSYPFPIPCATRFYPHTPKSRYGEMRQGSERGRAKESP